MVLPLVGVRLIAVEQYGAGPYGTGYLADMGADVIKIEHRPTGGDMSRSVGPYFLGENDSHFFQTFNRNKRSLTLDLKHPDGREVFHRLVAKVDGIAGNLRGDQPKKLGITFQDLKQYNPRIVCAHLSAYGRDYNRFDWPGYDYLMQAEAGFLSLTGEPDGPPARFGLSVVDFMTGMVMAFGLLAGIISAREMGEGRDVDVSLYDVAMHQLSYPATWYLNEGLRTERLPRSAHPYVTPSQLYKTADGWILLMCQTQKFWEELCKLLNKNDLIYDERFKDYAGRHACREQLTSILDEQLSFHPTEEWVSLFSGKVPCAPVYDLAKALDNPYFRERGGVQTVRHPDRKELKLLNSPLRLTDDIPSRPAPKLGQHSDEILRELGYGDEDIVRMKENDVV